MEKYLFTDGTNVTREVQSKEELDLLLQSATDRDKVRIWIFNTSEWINYAEFSKRSAPKVITLPKKTVPRQPKKETTPVEVQPARRRGWLKRSFIVLLSVLTILLVYNFTRITWTHIAPLTITTLRPANTPPVDADSLIQAIEFTRGQKLDKITRTNLRIRNTWPDRIVLQLTADRDSSSTGIKSHHLELSLDNSTGYLIDEAVVELRTWKDQRISSTDTFHFRNINYALPAKRIVSTEYRADSIAVSFSLIKAKSFNFCYSADKESNYGNYNDRWFCK